MEIKNILVVGAGVMGQGIAQVFSQSNHNVFIIDVKEELTLRGIKRIEDNLTRLVQKEKISEDEKKSVMGRIKGIKEYEEAKEADFVIEAALENLNLKKEIFKILDEIMRSEVILSTNTSSLPITPIAASTKRPDKIIGMHFFNPAPVMKLVEVIKALTTSHETFQIVYELSKKIGKIPVEINDSPGFASSRILMVMINEAIFALWEGVGDAKNIDEVMKLGMAHPMGPLELADLIGLDICLHVMETLYEGFQESKYRPCPLLKKMVSAGYLGRKTGKGFYEYK